jgi:hypothetical protein
MGRRFLAAVGAALILIGLLPGRASAQPPATLFDRLPSRVRVGDIVWVQGDDGVEVKGKLWDLSPTSLEVMTGGQAKEFKAESVRAVWTREHDSFVNGALIGFGIGAGFAIVAMAATCEGDCYPGGVVAVLVYGGMGAGIGVGIDALTPAGRMKVYAQGAGPSSARVSVRPMISPRQQGLVVRVAF